MEGGADGVALPERRVVAEVPEGADDGQGVFLGLGLQLGAEVLLVLAQVVPDITALLHPFLQGVREFLLSKHR